MDTPPSRSPGDLIAGKYRLERPLGEGGQASVWEAHHVALDARVALKLVHPDADDLGQAERLLREAQAVARLRHPAVVRVFDVAQTNDGDWFIVMELLDGECLADKLADGRRLAPTEAVGLLLPIAEALVAAHAAGIVHRDVKPDNIVLSGAGKHVQPKLLDFGIAKRRDADWKRTTAKGVLMGTPAYLSPEQAECARDIDQRSDVWSFAVTVYECVTGRLPFDGETEQELLRSIMTGEPRSTLTSSAGDPELWRLLEGGLKKRREERCQSMKLLGTGLARWLLAQGVTEDARGVSLERTWLRSTLPPGPPIARTTTHRTRAAAPRVARWTAIGAGVAVVVLLAFASMLTRPAPPAEHAFAAATLVAQTPVAPEVVPVGKPLAVAASPVAASPVAASPVAAPPPIAPTTPAPARPHARPGPPPASSPAPRSSSIRDGLRLMNPY
jgi:tRNA A-37 threonylcarbamoyl transferase component Bud32